MCRFEVRELLALLEVLLAAARHIEHDDRILGDVSGRHLLDERGECDAGRRVDVDTLQLLEELTRLARLGVGRHEHLAAGGLQRVVETARKAVGGTTVRKHLGVDDFGVAARLVVVVGQHLSRIGPPGVVHRDERSVLGHHQLHEVAAEAAVLNQTQVGLPGGNSTRAAADGLEVVVGNPADGSRGREHGRRHAVAAGDVLRAALGVELAALERQIREVDGIEVVAAPLARDELDAGVELMLEPERPDVVVGNREQQRNPVVGAYLGEGAGRVAGRGDHQHPLLALGNAGADREGLGLLERAGRHLRPDGGIPAVEGNPEILQTEVPGQSAAAVGYGCRGALEHAPDGQPVAELVESVGVGLHFELLAGITGPHQRGCGRRMVLERPAVILEFASGGHALEGVAGRGKFFHVSMFD